MHTSYGIVLHEHRFYILVNAGFGDPVDVLLEFKVPGVCYIHTYYQGIETLMYHDGRPYKTVKLIFTVNDHGSILTARYLFYNFSGDLISLPNVENDARTSIRMARIVLLCDYVRHDLPNAIKDAVQTSRLGKDKKIDEVCVICLKEYEVEDMIGTLICKHQYHDECIKKWLSKTENRNCPVCRHHSIQFED
ncbi:hypothetical protein QVD17_35784 [Tagetes erecta]|uniref:RING-type E3 ubiquitin transferase n=1 Tax=Tagetes erecta TaxID=13708 RepID=A0AAD8JT51_TARER|nr:hypothetical protein QVD17_35784 [Tagetes erecta]